MIILNFILGGIFAVFFYERGYRLGRGDAIKPNPLKAFIQSIMPKEKVVEDDYDKVSNYDPFAKKEGE